MLSGLSPQAAGDLLFTVGLLIGNQAASGRLEKGHRHAEALLNGAVAIFEQVSLNNRSAEARIEIGRCFYREGLFELSAENLVAALRLIDEGEPELRSTCLVVFGAIDREAGRLAESMEKLNEAYQLCVPRTLTAFRCYFELATTLKSLALVEGNSIHADVAARHFNQAIWECDAIGNHLFEANVRNNLGFLLVNTGNFEESEFHLLRSRHLFAALGDEVRAAVVNDTLAQLYIATKDYERAWASIEAAVKVLERNDSEAMLTEALVTKGLVASRLDQTREALKILQGARKVAERCGFQQEIARILLILHEGLYEHLQESERQEIIREMKDFAERKSGGAYFHRIKKLVSFVGDS